MSTLYLGVISYQKAQRLEGLLDSIDTELALLVVVALMPDTEFERVLAKRRRHIRKQIDERFPHNIGVAAGWNIILSRSFDAGASCVAVANDDVWFERGSLARFADWTSSHLLGCKAMQPTDGWPVRRALSVGQNERVDSWSDVPLLQGKRERGRESSFFFRFRIGFCAQYTQVRDKTTLVCLHKSFFRV